MRYISTASLAFSLAPRSEGQGFNPAVKDGCKSRALAPEARVLLAERLAR